MNLEQFKELFNPLPGNQYLQVTTSVDDTASELYKMMKSVDGELSIIIYDENDVDIDSKFPDAKIQQIKSFQQPFRAKSRNHDIVVYKDIFYAHENQNMMLKLAYTTLGNAANIIIMEKKGIMDIEALKVMLEEFEFRAANEIDIVDGYDLVMAKKMHMWGNGL
jgi:hypothetical protein